MLGKPFSNPENLLHHSHLITGLLSLLWSLYHLVIGQPTFSVYIEPNSKNKSSVFLFIEQLPALFEFCKSIGGSVLILGDFNFHYDRPDDPYV